MSVVLAERVPGGKKRAKVDAEKVRARVVAAFAGGDYSCASENEKGEFAPVIAKAKASLAKIDPSAKLDERVEAVAAIYAGVGASRRRGAAAADKAFVDRWVLGGGVVLAVRALARTFDFATEQEYGGKIVRGDPEDTSFSERPWTILREHLNAASDDEYAEARDAALALRAKATIRLRCALTHAFSTEAAWAAEDAREGLGLRTRGGYRLSCVRHVLPTLRDGDLARAVVEADPIFSHEYAPTIAERLGDAAVPALALMLHSESYRDEAKQSAVDALVRIESPAAATELAKALKYGGGLQGAVVDYFTRFPALAQQALEPIAKQKGAQALVATTLLKKLGSRAPKPKTDIALPPIFSSPPWAPRAKKPATKVAVDPSRAAPAYVERVVFEDADKKVLAEIHEENAGRERAKNEAKEIARLEAPPEKGDEHSPWELWSVSDAAALDVWNRAKVDEWWVSDERDGLEIMDRLGAPAVPTLARFAMEHRCRARILPALTRADSPAAAPAIAEALAKMKKHADKARAWLATYPEAAAIGLVPAALSGSKTAALALEELVALGHGDVVSRVKKHYGSTDVSDDTFGFARVSKPPALPKFVNATMLDTSLPESALETLVRLLVLAPPDRTPAGLAEARDALGRDAMRALAWQLFDAWETDGSPPSGTWALHALGHFGDDETAAKLAPMIIEWASVAHQRAEAGLKTLALIGTTRALVELARIAERTRYPALGKKARDAIASVARSRGMTAEALADWLVPELGLEEDGTCALEVRGETFTVGFDAELRPFVTDAAGARKDALPKPRSNDDDDEAVARWATLKREVRKIVPEQLRRIERAMIAQRRFDLGAFQHAFVAHRLLLHIVRRLVWAAHEGDATTFFRVADDGTFATVDDRPFVPNAGAEITVAHPLGLGKDGCARWSTALGDYEIVQPFPQVGREVYGERDLTSAIGRNVPHTALLALEHRGWKRADERGRFVTDFERDVGGGRSVRVTFSPGLDRSELASSGEQKIASCVPVVAKTFAELGPIWISEIARDLSS